MAEALDAFRLAAFLASGETADLVDHAFNLTERHGHTIKAIIALRQAAATLRNNEDDRAERDVLAGLVKWLTMLRDEKGRLRLCTPA